MFRIFDVAGSAMNAQSVRLNVTASNLANSGSVSGDPDKVYRARHPVFSSFNDSLAHQQSANGVRLEQIVESNGALDKRYQPDHPESDADGNVYVSNVNTIEEMVNMMSASRSYKNNVEMINTTKDMLLQTLSLGR